MGVEPPFLYDPPSSRYSSRYGNFNPKAVSHASLQAPLPRPKQEGPLVDFNTHPDSYLIQPYGNVQAKSMSPRTKNRVKWTRWVQLGLRVLELVGAVGALVGAICIRGIDGTDGWIIRIAVRILSGSGLLGD